MIEPLNALQRMRSRFGKIESGSTLAKWLGMGLAIGIVAGLGAIVFTWSIDFCTHLFLGVAGYTPPSALGEGTNTIQPAKYPWLFPIILTIGGLVSGYIVFHTAPEAEGHGTDAAIASFHYKGGKVRARVPLIKLIASSITIGSGGSGGREGPTAQIASGFGSILATKLGMSVADRRIALVAGMGAGIGAIFRAPLGGAVMSAEILYLGDLEVEVLIPALVAAIVGYSIYASVYGWAPIFGAALGTISFNTPVQLIYYAILGVICGLMGLLYAKSFISFSHFFHHLRIRGKHIPNWIKPGIGGFLVGLMGIVSPGFIHMGYGWVQATMSPSAVDGLMSLPLWLVILLPFGKILATSLSIGSGGSGGIFGPGMVIGGFVGAAFWRLTETWLPGMPNSPAPFVIIAMMAMFGGIAHAPLAVMLMVAEMTGNLNLLAPAMVAVAISLLICGNNTIYVNQVNSRAESPAHRYRYSFPLLASLPISDALQTKVPLLNPDMTIVEAQKLMNANNSSGLPVVANGRKLIGVLTHADLERYHQQQAEALAAGKNVATNPLVKDAMNAEPVVMPVTESLDRVLESLAEHKISWLPVVEDLTSMKVAGVVGASEVVKSYQLAMSQGMRSLGATVSGMSMTEIQLSQTATANNHALRELTLPEDTLVVSIHRNGELIVPRGTTKLQAGDLLTILTGSSQQERVGFYLERAPIDSTAKEGLRIFPSSD